jgi:hypothetical protein
MRARRRFQPTLDVLPMRLAPSDLGVPVSPTDPVSGPSTTPAPIISPTDPTSGPDPGPSVGDPTSIGPGSYTTTATTTLSC